MIRTRTLALVPLSPLLLAGALAAHEPGAPAGEPELRAGRAERFESLLEHRSDRLADALELSDAQRSQFEKLRAERLEAARPTFRAMRDSGRELRELLDAAKPDPTEVGERMIALHRLRGEIEAAKDAFESDFAALLTPEQKIAFDALERVRGDRDDRRRDGRFGRGFGGDFGGRGSRHGADGAGN